MNAGATWLSEEGSMGGTAALAAPKWAALSATSMARFTIVLIGVAGSAGSGAALHNIYTDDEVKMCGGYIGKGPNLVSSGEWIHVSNGCGGGTDAATSLRENGLVGDSVNRNVCIMKSSQDSGDTWTNFQVTTPGGIEGKNFSGCKVVYDRIGKTLILQYFYFPSGESSDTRGASLYQKTSKDHGKSWSSPENITDVLKPCAAANGAMVSGVAGNRIQTPTGRIIFGGFGYHGQRCLWYSDDGGKTYKSNGLHGERTNEWSIALADNRTGRLLINSRGNPFRENYWSGDNGLTWTDAKQSDLRDSINSHNHGCEASLTNIDNRLFFFNPSGQGKDARTKMVVRCSHDHGTHWHHSYPITSTDQGGYSDMLHVYHQKEGKTLMLAWGYNKNDESQPPDRNIYIEHIDTKWCS